MHLPAEKAQARTRRGAGTPDAASARAAGTAPALAPGSFYSAGPALSLGAAVQTKLAEPAEEEQPAVQQRAVQLCDCEHEEEGENDTVQQRAVQLWDCGEYSEPTCKFEEQVQEKCADCEAEEPVQQTCAACGAEESVQQKCAACAAKEEEPVQQKCAACAAKEEAQIQHAGAPRRSPQLIQQEARRGLQGASQPLPHGDRIQAAFGRHDLSQVQASVGAGAGSANRRMGALAFTSGDRIGFRQTPSLHLAAHEAAHVVQQREGLSLPNNVGRAGDRWERHADQVADAVVAGRSAESLLNEVATPPTATSSAASIPAPASRAAGPANIGPAGPAAVQHQITSRAARLIESPQAPAEMPEQAPAGGAAAPKQADSSAEPGEGDADGAAMDAAKQGDNETPPEGVDANGAAAGGGGGATAPDGGSESASPAGGAPAGGVAPPSSSTPAGGAPSPAPAAGAPAADAASTTADPAASGQAPAAETPAAAGGGAVSGSCYSAASPAPPDNTPDPTKDDRSSKPEEKPQITFAPWPADADVCKAEPAVAQAAQQMPDAIGAGQSPAGAAPAASAAPAPGPAEGVATAGASPAGAASTTSAGGAGAGGEQAPAQAAPAAAEQAIASSDMDGPITGAESERDTAVGDYNTAAGGLGAVLARAQNLETGVTFAPASGSRQFLARQAAVAQVRGFMARAGGQIGDAVAFAQVQVPGRLGGLAENAKAGIQGAIETEKGAISARIAQSRAQALAGAAGARAHVHAQYASSAALIEAMTATALTTIDTQHTTLVGQVNTKETAGLDDVNSRFATGRTTHEAKGPEYAKRALARGQEHAHAYEHCKGDYSDDGFWDGCLTVRRAKAQQDTACKTAAGYQEGFLRTANKKGYDLIALRRQFRCAVIAGAREVNKTLDDTHSSLVSGLETGRTQAMKGIALARDENLAMIGRALAATLQALAAQEHTQRQSVNDTGYLKQLAIERLAHAGAAGLARGIAGAMDSLEQTLVALSGRFAKGDIPEPAALAESLAATEAALGGGMGTLLAKMDEGAQGTEERLTQLGVVSLEGLATITAQNDEQAAQAESGFAQQMSGIRAGASKAFGTLTGNHIKQCTQAMTEGVASMKQAVAGFDKALATIGGNIDKAIASSLKELDQDLSKTLGGLDAKIASEAWKAAEKEQPAWKSVVAIVLVIIVIIVAAVISIVTLGAGASLFAVILVGALVGAVSAGLIQIINNWASGEAWDTGLVQAMVMGAIGGAIGGGLGFAGGALSAGAAVAGARVATQVLIHVGTDLIAEGLTQTVGYFAYGQKFSWQGFVTAGVMSGVSFRAHVGGPHGGTAHPEVSVPHAGGAGGGRRAAVAQVAGGAAVGLGVEYATSKISGEKVDMTRAASSAASGAVGAHMSRRGGAAGHAPEQPTSALGRAAERVRSFDPGGVGARLEGTLKSAGGRLVGGPAAPERPAGGTPRVEEPAATSRTTEEPATAPRSTEEPATAPRTTEEPAATPRSTTEEPATPPRTTEEPAAMPRSTTEEPATPPRATEEPAGKGPQREFSASKDLNDPRVQQEISDLGPMTPETRQLLADNPLLRQALLENPAAARVLKRCASPCFPTNMHLADVERIGKLLESHPDIDPSRLTDYLYQHRGSAESIATAVDTLANAPNPKLFIENTPLANRVTGATLDDAVVAKLREIERNPGTFDELIAKGYPSEVLQGALAKFEGTIGRGEFANLIDYLQSFGTGNKPRALVQALEEVHAGASSDFLSRVANMHTEESLRPINIDRLRASYDAGDALLAVGHLQDGITPAKPHEIIDGYILQSPSAGRPSKQLINDWGSKVDFVIVDRGSGIELVFGKEHSGLSGGATSVHGAGELVFNKDGAIVGMTNGSGHYRPTAANLERSYQWLVANGYLSPTMSVTRDARF